LINWKKFKKNLSNQIAKN